MNVTFIFIVFLLIMSVLAIILYRMDKTKAQKGAWRIKEATLLLVGFLGGAAGALLGMRLFRHKTKHWYFWAVNIAGLAWQIIVIFLLAGKA